MPESALSPRNSLVPDSALSPRNSLVPDQNRTPRHSLTPDSSAYNSRLNIAADYNRSPRNSLVPGGERVQRQILTPSESTTWPQEEGKDFKYEFHRKVFLPIKSCISAPQTTAKRCDVSITYALYCFVASLSKRPGGTCAGKVVSYTKKRCL